MMMNASLKAAAIGSLLFMGAHVDAAYPCNPSVHCDPRSQQCQPSDYIRALIRGEPVHEQDYSTSRGICTDAYRWLCDADGENCVKKPYTDQGLQERCITILFPCQDCPELKDFQASDFVYSCQVGKYTCNDGRCVDKDSQCGAIGVRFDNVRCPKDLCGIDDIVEKECDKVAPSKIVASEECSGPGPSVISPCCMPDNLGECQVFPIDRTGLDLSAKQCGNVCPTSSECATTGSPTASPTTAASASKYGIVGIDIDIAFGNSEHSCCCRLSCDCFGDPHCTNFFALQQTTKKEVGRYRMYEAGSFSVWANLGEPHGVVSQLDVISSDPDYKDIMFSINSDDCVDLDENKNWRNGKVGTLLKKSQLPKTWYSRPTLGNIFSDPNTFYVIDNGAKIAVEVKCMSFYVGATVANRQLKRRLDIHVTKWNDVNNNGCCPTESESASWFKQNNAAGYCVGSESLPGAAQLQGSKGGQVFLSATFGLDTPQNSIPSDANMNDEAEKLCEKYLALIQDPANAGIVIPALDSKTACILNVLDFGLENLAKLIESLDSEEPDCIASFNHPYLFKVPGQCEQALTLEARAPGDTTWKIVRYLPAAYKYCDNKLYLDFGNLYTVDGKFKITKDFDLQFKRCPVDTSICGQCEPLREIQALDLKYVYECNDYDTQKETVKETLLNAFKTGAISCGINYKKSKNPLQCLQDQFPDIFSGTAIVEDPDTKNPTRKPSQTTGNTKKPTANPTSKPTYDPARPIAPNCAKIGTYENCLKFANCRWKLYGTGGLCISKPT